MYPLTNLTINQGLRNETKDYSSCSSKGSRKSCAIGPKAM